MSLALAGSPATTAVPASFRSSALRGKLAGSRLDGSSLLVEGATSDLLMDGVSMRGILPAIAAWAAESGRSTLVFSLAGGARRLTAPGGPAARIPVGVTDGTPPTISLQILIEAFLRDPDPRVLVVDYVDALLADDSGLGFATADHARMLEQLNELTTDAAWRRAGHQLILVARTSPPDRRIARMPAVAQFEMGLPLQDERLASLLGMVESPSHRLVLDGDLTAERAARLSGGLSLRALSALRFGTSPTTPLTARDIVSAKEALIARTAGSSLVVVQDALDLSADIAGVPQVRRALAEEARRGSGRVRIILAGPPGCGKSRLVTAVGAALGVPVLRLGRIRAKFVGESEDNLRLALRTMEAFAPCLLEMDEIDQSAMGQRGEAGSADDSEVTANLRAELFAWLGDVGDDLGISVVGLTNRVDLLDEAAIDRFSVLPVLFPTAAEAAQIMAIQARDAGIDFDVEAAAAALAASRQVYSGRDAIRILERAQVHAQEAGREAVTGDDVAQALAEAMKRVGPGEERQALISILSTSWAGHLPWNAARYWGDTEARPPAYLEPYVYSNGMVDTAALSQRARELEGRHGF